jgi:type II secretory pathway pseudopilin PulG
LIELVVVIIIFGVLAGIIAPQYNRSRERAFDKQARTILTLIRAAQKAYWLTQEGYYAPGTTTIGAINTNLNLNLPNDGNWGSYSITGASGFTASVQRDRGGYDRTWTITAATENATCSPSASCP